ncbi:MULTISPECIES: carbonic anhydrase [unclassified Mycobacterium]|uniref:carbonic anhydrase n=1 Tax=unclassified Mycobacterium TaxID=2642494 RepID=UPI0029C7BCA2|nr:MULTISPECIES: carbonic anhydrase [unclassified Mycobacterium]
MAVVDTLAERNDDFARTRFIPGLPMLPRLRTLVVGCVDPRVDPAHVLGLETGDAAVIRNVGGRVTPDVVAELALLGRLARSLVGSAAPVIDLIVMQHTDCGITRLQDPPDMLAAYFRVDPTDLADKHVADARAAVASDIAVLQSAPQLAAAFRVTGVVYDVDSGRIDIVHSEVKEPA